MCVVDHIDERIAGDAGSAYASPPQPLGDALALVRLVLDGPAHAQGESGRWTRGIVGGRTVTLARAAHAP